MCGDGQFSAEKQTKVSSTGARIDSLFHHLPPAHAFLELASYGDTSTESTSLASTVSPSCVKVVNGKFLSNGKDRIPRTPHSTFHCRVISLGLRVSRSTIFVKKTPAVINFVPLSRQTAKPLYSNIMQLTRLPVGL